MALPNAIYATDPPYNVVVNDGTDQTGNLSAAIQAAIANRACLMLPAGIISVNLDMLGTGAGGKIVVAPPPGELWGALAIRGLGVGVTLINQRNTTGGGLYFDLSTQNSHGQLINSVDLSDFTVQAAPGTAFSGQTAITLDYYGPYAPLPQPPAPLPPPPVPLVPLDTLVSRVSNIAVLYFDSAFLFINCWNSAFKNLYLKGNYNDVPSNVETAIEFRSCVNCRLSNVYVEYFNTGVYLSKINASPVYPNLARYPGSGCQGINIDNWHSVKTPYALMNDQTTQLTDGNGTINFLNFVFDNGAVGSTPGSNPGPYNTVMMQGVDNLLLSNGTIIQALGVSEVYLSDCQNPRLIGVNMYYANNGQQGDSVLIVNASNGALVTGCTFGINPPHYAVNLDSSTNRCRVRTNIYWGSGNQNHSTLSPGNDVE